MLDVVTFEGSNRTRHLVGIKDTEELQSSLEGTNASAEALDALHQNDAHEVRKTVLLNAHGFPVTALESLPLTDVAIGVNIGQAGDRAICARHVGTIDNHFVAGQQLKRVASGLVRTGQPAEAHIVTGGILNAVKNAFLTQAKNKIVLKLRVDADGNVVGPQLKTGVLLKDAEVLLDLCLAAQCIEGSGCNDAQSSTDFFNCLDVLNDTLSNLAYWRDWDWWGFGPGAHSHVGRYRWWNVKHPSAYAQRVTQGLSPAQAGEILDAQTREMERVLLAVRTSEGVEAPTAGAERETFLQALLALASEGLIEAVPAAQGRAIVTLQGRLLADYVTRCLLGY